MTQFLVNNGGTLFTALVVSAIVAAIVVHLVRKKKHGVHSCSCGCEQCHGACHPE